MATIAESTALNFVMLAAAKTLLLNLIRVLSITFKYELERLEFGALMRSIAEWLILRFTACAIIIGLSLLKIYFVGFLLSYDSLSAISMKLTTISYKAWRLLFLVFISLFYFFFKNFLLFFLDLLFSLCFFLNNRSDFLLLDFLKNLSCLWDNSRFLMYFIFF